MCKKFVILHKLSHTGPTSCYLTFNWLYRTSHNFIVKWRHKNIRMMSVLFKMADINVGVLKGKNGNVGVFKGKNGFIKALAPKSMQEKESNMHLWIG